MSVHELLHSCSTDSNVFYLTFGCRKLSENDVGDLSSILGSVYVNENGGGGEATLHASPAEENGGAPARHQTVNPSLSVPDFFK